MFEHIVVAAHFASASSPLFASLEELRNRGARELTLVDVLRSHHPEEQAEEHRVEARRRLEEEKSALEEAGFTVNIELRTGQPAHELYTIARARRANLILVGSRGEQYFREFLRGSTVLQLIRKTSTPTLLEPIEAGYRQVRGRGFDHLLLATDFSTGAGAAEKMALELAPSARGLVLLHVVEDEEAEALGEEGAMQAARDKLQALADRLPRLRYEPVIRVERGTASTEIRRLAEAEGATMLILGKRGQSPIRELLLGSTIQNVVRYATQSVLLVPQGLADIDS